MKDCSWPVRVAAAMIFFFTISTDGGGTEAPVSCLSFVYIFRRRGTSLQGGSVEVSAGVEALHASTREVDGEDAHVGPKEYVVSTG